MSVNLSCPQVFLGSGGGLPVAHMDVDVCVSVTVATVQIRTVFLHHSSFPSVGVYKAPNSYGRASISSCEISFPGTRLVTSVIDPDVITNVNPNPNSAVDTFDPLAFSMGFSDCPPNCEVIITVNYIQELEFNQSGMYELIVPTCVPYALVSRSPRYPDLCSIRCVMDVGALHCQWSSKSHAMGVTHSAGGPCITIQSQPGTGVNNAFHIQYSAYSPTISGTCLVQQSPHQQGNFVAFISPPSTFQPHAVVGRDMVFLLDRSGSMNGRPIEEAKRALIVALQRLTFQDRFAICAFDDSSEWFGAGAGPDAAPTLMQPNPQTLAVACQWVQAVQARYTTDILTPYNTATYMLLDADSSPGGHLRAASVSPNPASSNLPIIFLITDGAVYNEHDICAFAQRQAVELQRQYPHKKTIRTFTYGIGPFVNQFFLKTLASKGRGYSHICLHEDQIETTIVELMNRTQNPILVNVVLNIPSSAGVLHISPSICPDLYHGCPIVLSGKYIGQSFPATICATGIDSSGQMLQINIGVRPPYTNGNVNLGIAYAVSYMDSQISNYWSYRQEGNMQAAEKCKQYAIESSINSSVPCVFTKTVAYETTDAPDNNRSQNQNQNQQNKKGMSNGAKVAAGAGGMILLGAAATSVVMFGNVGATSNNIPVTNVFGALSNMSLDVSALSGVVDTLSTAAGGVGQAFGDLGSMIGPGLSAAGGGIANAAQNLGQGIGNVAGHVGNGIAPVAQTVGQGIGNAAGTVGRGIAPVAQTVGQGIGNAAGTVGRGIAPVAQNVGQGIGNAAGTVGNNIAPAAQTVGQGIGNAAGTVGRGIAPVAQNVGAGVKDAGGDCCSGGCCCLDLDSLCGCFKGVGNALDCCKGGCDCIDINSLCSCCSNIGNMIDGIGNCDCGQLRPILRCILGLIGGVNFD